MNDQPYIDLFSELGDKTEDMDLRELSDYITTLKRVLLCTEVLGDMEDKQSNEARCQYHNALAHLDLAANAMRLARYKHKTEPPFEIVSQS